MAERPCSFCDSNASNFPHFKQLGREQLDRVHLFETDNLYVKSDILPASPDFHLLMIPKPHQFSYASHAGTLDTELGHLLGRVEEEFGEPLIFMEHGGVGEGQKIQSVYHNHAHIFPKKGLRVVDYMGDVLGALGIDFDVLQGLDRSPTVNLGKAFKGHNYLYIQDGTDGLIAHDAEDKFPSQITQLNMSKLLSGQALNWKQIPENEEFAKLSVGRIAHIIEKCKKM